MPGWNESAWFSLFVGAALKSTFVLGAAWLVAMALRRRSAAAVHLVWTAGSAALLALPLLSLTVPALRVRVPAALVPPGLVFRTNALAAADASPQVASRAAAAGSPAAPAPWHPDWRLCLMLLWAAGFTAASLQMLVGWAAMRRLRRNAKPLRDPALQPLLDGCRVDLLESTAGSMPVSFGLFRPSIFMPADAADWNAERRRVVLLHELAHVRRGDHATHLVARAALSFYWWNPLAWTVWREFLKSRERAADDMVLGAGAAAPDYAGHLLEIARTMQAAPAADWAAIAMARPSQLEGRLLAILDSRRSRKSRGRASAWVVALAAAAIAVPLAALQAQDAAPRGFLVLDATVRADEAAGNYDEARKLLDSSLATLERTDGPKSASYGLGLLKIGDLEAQRVNAVEAESFYERALTLLQGTPDAATALIDLGTLVLSRMGRDPDQAFAYFERAQTADPAKAGTALMWQAVARDRQGRSAEAESLFRSAISVQDPKSPQAATIVEVYASFLRRNNRLYDNRNADDEADFLRKQLAWTAAPAPPVHTSDSVRVGGGVTAPMLEHKVEPQYTEEARAAKFSGTVVLYVEIGPDGIARNMQVVRSLGLGLDQKAIDAVSQWQFRPGAKDGVPVTVQATIEVNFRLL